jgi:hypothetical protein
LPIVPIGSSSQVFPVRKKMPTTSALSKKKQFNGEVDEKI